MSITVQYWIRFALVCLGCSFSDVWFNHAVGIRNGSLIDWVLFIPFYLLSWYTFVYSWRRKHMDTEV